MSDETGGLNRPASATRTPRILSGFRDLMPRQMVVRQRIIAIFREIFERHGFEPLDTPALEYLDVLTGKAGENEKLMYQFEDHGGRMVGLRYDLTVPLARVVAMHQNEVVMPFKRYHIAPVWRGEHAQRGRFREFWQCDADIAGSPSMVADAEIVSIIAEALTAVRLPNFTIHISHRRLLSSLGISLGAPRELAGSMYRAVDKLGKIGANGVRAELVEAGYPEATADRILDAVTADGTPTDLLTMLRPRLEGTPDGVAAVDELAELFGLLPAFGVAESAFCLDLSLARGLDYYTGPVYEATVHEPKIGSVAGAGRYDGLIGAFLGREIPATGMSLGLERIIEVVQEFDLLPVNAAAADVAVVYLPDTIMPAAELATRLRTAGLRVDFSLSGRRGFGEQLKLADRRGIPVAAIVGQAEVAAGTVRLKHLGAGTQVDVKAEDAAEAIRGQLAPTASPA